MNHHLYLLKLKSILANNFVLFGFLLYLIITVLAGCSESVAPISNTVQTGVFKDSTVEGLDYATVTQSGTTNSSGKFNFINGEKIFFSVGDVLLGSTDAALEITPKDTAGKSDINDPVVINQAIFLQSLDNDGDPYNGINITSAIALAMKDAIESGNLSIDFNLPNNDFIFSSSDFYKLMEALNSAGDLFESTGGKIKTPSDALRHLKASTSTDKFPLLISADNSPTKKPVYLGEFGIALIVEGKTKKMSENIATKYNSARIVPHITILQGKFTEERYRALEKFLRKYVSTLTKIPVQMKNLIEKGGGGNTFWNVQDGASRDWLNKINEECSKAIDPVLVMKQVYDDPNADMDLVKKYGRDFNVPGHNNPHITVAYGIQDTTLESDISDELAKEGDWIFDPVKLAIVQIDYVGNVVKTVKEFLFK